MQRFLCAVAVAGSNICSAAHGNPQAALLCTSLYETLDSDLSPSALVLKRPVTNEELLSPGAPYIKKTLTVSDHGEWYC